jgi:hypothetical protein
MRAQDRLGRRTPLTLCGRVPGLCVVALLPRLRLTLLEVHGVALQDRCLAMLVCAGGGTPRAGSGLPALRELTLRDVVVTQDAGRSAQGAPDAAAAQPGWPGAQQQAGAQLPPQPGNGVGGAAAHNAAPEPGPPATASRVGRE